ncbi:hypothetical protein PFICI_10373 [Pestalotiopsis fici W106-1]|uniref:Alpha-1,3-mannosyltransferase CMT1 n=1 Tax=Pestalotiopsis fici (strain W106-1 / CGMCC3.15140) TaxID=1229662 RepID=W3WZK3_PESFW|nr:uncharacterized protein PFICI_10373 [Pestalotiopsis fici W106-1]ETS78311.1 hypothetical protein PFICI_10373 [Pestalotiopsis fici W106-1]
MAPYVAAIMDPTDAVIHRLECPRLLTTRYAHLKADHKNHPDAGGIRYFFALDLGNSFHVIPRLLGSIVETIMFLGPSVCALSIVVGKSNDATLNVLEALRPELDDLGLRYFLYSSRIDPGSGDRTVQMAALRNLALAPLEEPALGANANTTVVFLGDVAICMDDILELVHQRIFLGADMTCALDWEYLGQDPTFKGIRVSRTMKGETFFQIPPDGSWDWAWNLFWNDPYSREKLTNKLPFQVYSCWNGAVAFRAAPILRFSSVEEDGHGGNDVGKTQAEKISFRSSREGECSNEEPALFCKDLWNSGHGKIAVVPSINLEYSDDAARRIKDLEGYTSKWINKWGDDALRIDWEDEPPAKVKCIAQDWKNQDWRPWNETMV